MSSYVFCNDDARLYHDAVIDGNNYRRRHDTTHRGTLKELFDEFSATPPKGEIVLVVRGA